ncbi:STAS-like domain-containing protein [Mycoplasmatota bacterium WC30]
MEKLIYKNDNGKCYFTFQRDSFKNINVSSVFIRAIKYNIKHEVKQVYIDFSEVRGGYPNLFVSIAGLLKLFKKEFDVFEITPKTPNFQSLKSALVPIVKKRGGKLKSLLNRVFEFTSDEEVEYYSNRIVNELSRELDFAEGTLVGFSWCVNEIMDNVLNHSDVEKGFIFTQIHKNKSSIVVSIYDTGQGMYNSLKHSNHAPKNNLDAITMSIKKGVTRDIKFGQGNGLWGLSSITINNGGAFTITSGSNSLNVSHNDYDGKEHVSRHFDKIPYPNKNHRTTLVNFTLRYDKDIDLYSILDDYEPFEAFQREIELHEGDDGVLCYNISEIAHGTGTRQSGKKLRNYIINILKTSKQKVILDFNDVSVMTSSFADEFLGKAVNILGFVRYNEYVQLQNCNPLISEIINKAIIDRMRS